ncbi:hypothetical protein [Romboutsia sp.]|uniref:hypothetical protein n=1 Tax=Romboutsia sp. TaxID=1965302 RepID=UPI002C9555D6|nr:hypothetical protein [Romboutsia sp.]HSQ89941.1 hypothetical protein [Romboutsia sp.]
MSYRNSTKGDYSPIINDSTFTFDMKLKNKNVMERKEKIYIPLIEDLNNSFIFPNGDLFSKLEFSFLKEVLDKQYLYRLEDELLNKFKDFNILVDEFNKLDLTYVASKLIESSFREGFHNLYGEIIDGEIPIYDDEGNLVAWDIVEPEEFDNIRLISYSTKEIIELINNQYDYQFDNLGYNYESELNINPYLSNFYEFALAKRNKKNSPQRTQIIDWNGRPEDYIASHYNFYSNFYSDSKVKEKESLLSKIKISRITLLNELDKILKYIFVTYEKE